MISQPARALKGMTETDAALLCQPGRAGRRALPARRLRHRRHAAGAGLPPALHRCSRCSWRRPPFAARRAARARWHLFAVGAIDLVTKPLARALACCAATLRGRGLRAGARSRRSLNIPTSLLIALALAVAAHFFTAPWLVAVPPARPRASTCRSAWPACCSAPTRWRSGARPCRSCIGLLAMENGAFFAGIAVAPDAAAHRRGRARLRRAGLAFIVGVLTRRIARADRRRPRSAR